MAGKIARFALAALLLALVASAALAASTLPKPAPAVPVKGMVTMVDLGAGYCVPCRMMEPVLKEAEREYRGRAAVVFVDVTKYASLATSLGIRAIPTQIFFDKNGKEISRHEGFLDKKSISAQLDKLLAR